MARSTFAGDLRLLRAHLDGVDRQIEMALALKRAKTGETLMLAGGVWDVVEERYLDWSHQEPTYVTEIDLEESQVEFVTWFAGELADYRDGFQRDIAAALAGGDRRGGKTFSVYFCQIGALIEVPLVPGKKSLPSVGWTVSKTFREREELDDLVTAYLPDHWYRKVSQPEYRYEFKVGSRLRNLSEDDPDALKQGRVEWLFYNEVQKMRARSVVNGLYGTADNGGLCLMTANKPTEADSRGEWLFDLKEAIDDEVRARAARKPVSKPVHVKFFGFSSKQNTKIDKPSRKRVAVVAGIIDPTSIESNDAAPDEVWRRPGDRACWEFDKHKHLNALPAAGFRKVEITAELAQRHFYLPGTTIAIAGGDFQFKPHIVGAFCRMFGDPERPQYHFVDEHVEKRATEEQFLEGIRQRLPLYRPENTLWVLDASAFWQGAKHDFEENERFSSDVLIADGWAAVPPQPPRGKTGRGRNPPVDERLSLFNEVIRQGRFQIDPVRCPWLAECAREATTQRETGRRHLVANKWAHAIDAMSYIIWLIEPKPADRHRPSADDVVLVDRNR